MEKVRGGQGRVGKRPRVGGGTTWVIVVVGCVCVRPRENGDEEETRRGRNS